VMRGTASVMAGRESEPGDETELPADPGALLAVATDNPWTRIGGRKRSNGSARYQGRPNAT
jgi:hypothetical protein